MSIELSIYLGLHALGTIGAIFVFFLRMEHRITRLETKVELIEKKLTC